MANNISTLITAGLDAFVNLYDVEVVLPMNIPSTDLADKTFAPGDAQVSKIKTRVGNFQPPDSSLGTYPQYYQSASITRQNAKIALTRTITLPFRVDGSYDLYRVLKSWQALYLGTNQGDYRLPDISEPNYFGNIIVYGYSSQTNTTGPVTGDLTSKVQWDFDNVMCIDVAEPQLGRDSANPIEVSATFLYYYVTPPTTT